MKSSRYRQRLLPASQQLGHGFPPSDIRSQDRNSRRTIVTVSLRSLSSQVRNFLSGLNRRYLSGLCDGDRYVGQALMAVVAVSSQADRPRCRGPGLWHRPAR